MSKKKYRKRPKDHTEDLRLLARVGESQEKSAATDDTPTEPAPTSTSPSGRTYRQAALDGISDEDLEGFIQNGWEIVNLLNRRIPGPTAHISPDMNDTEVRQTLADCTRFLRQVVNITGGVVQTVDVKEFRNIVAGDVKIPDSMKVALETAGMDPSAIFDNESKTPRELQRESPQKRPRGAEHPLIKLLRLAAQSVRLIERITRGTHPKAHNKLTIDEEVALKREQAQERTTAAMWRGG